MKTHCTTKQRLLDTAIRLIWEQSYGAVSVDHICERAGAQKGSFYHFFPSKSELAVAAIEAHWQQRQLEMDRLFAPQTPPLERLAHYCDSVYRQQKAKRAEFGRVCGCAFTCLGLELSTQDEPVRHKSQQIIERLCRYLETAVRDAARAGLIDRRDFRVMGRELYRGIIGVLVQAKIENNLKVIRQLKPTIWRLIGARQARRR
jgi:TetR/AcrR family transcriptional repressor of nem operon